MKNLGSHIFKTRLVAESSYYAEDLGECDCEMVLWATAKGYHFIEWIVNDNAEAEIGLTFQGKEVVDYDGVFELPAEAVELLNKLGYSVNEELISIEVER